jgi:hypothetical protein
LLIRGENIPDTLSTVLKERISPQVNGLCYLQVYGFQAGISWIYVYQIGALVLIQKVELFYNYYQTTDEKFYTGIRIT